MNTNRLKICGLTCYFGLMIWIPTWLFLLAPSQQSILFTFTLWCLPLLLPVPGLIAGRPYTYAWCNFILVLYLGHGLTSLYVAEGEFWFALLETLLSTGAMLFTMLYARHRGRELGLGLKRKTPSLQR
jgi:uncharacterized membrane protein